MSLEKAEEYLKNKGMLDHVIRLEDSTATVVEAAQAGRGTGDDRKDHVVSSG